MLTEEVTEQDVAEVVAVDRDPGHPPDGGRGRSWSMEERLHDRVIGRGRGG